MRIFDIHKEIPRIDIKPIDTETGPGVYETALAYTDALRMADNAILFKFLAKSIGMKHGVVPSFMAKPWGNVSLEPVFPDLVLIIPASWMQRVSPHT